MKVTYLYLPPERTKGLSVKDFLKKRGSFGEESAKKGSFIVQIDQMGGNLQWHIGPNSKIVSSCASKRLFMDNCAQSAQKFAIFVLILLTIGHILALHGPK